MTRTERLRRLGAAPFDLCVVGGGITGAGVARDAAMRGLSVALLEADDYAAGTSSRSSRLIHGGVRYLEHGHLGLVFEASRERRTLLRIAPHLVRPLAFTWPVYRGARIQLWTLEAGLALYDALALFRNVGNHKRLSTRDVREREPALRSDGLVGGARYWDAATNDTRLTLANILAAEEHGAVCVNHCAVVARGDDADGYVRVTAHDGLRDTPVHVRARLVINAAGPWSDAVSTALGATRGAGVLGSKGVHITVPADTVAHRGALTLLAPHDGRVFFVLPAGAFTIIGTTETPTETRPDQVRANEADVHYLIDATRHFFPDSTLTRDAVIAAWAGVRPLAAQHVQGDAASASREHTIARTAPGMLSVTGGKLTTYRAMAADVVEHALTALGRRAAAAPTATTPLPGGDVEELAVAIARAVHAGHAPAVAERLVYSYGSGWVRLDHLVRDDDALGDEIEPGLPYLMAEVVYAARHEHAMTLADVLVRRTHVAFETRDHGRGAAARIAPLLAHELGWDAARSAQALDDYDREASRLFGIDPAPA
ncbi:MAG: glycerol-3-phosphate dehydrogenase/oxidase [Gemmatimonadaceae bacterium]|nr:glycerol-3-phosphate dehydrogenase/oxidase [Gemmatimonadaceae bacterium]